jgi:hypothetical protein
MQQRRITARRSSVHGKGLFALRPIAAGERLIEYAGELTQSVITINHRLTPSSPGLLSALATSLLQPYLQLDN